MDLANKVLSKAPISWTDVQKQLLTVIQTKGTSIHSSSSSTHQLPINKVFVKQCTDLLIKKIKNLNQGQVIEQLENLAQSCNLGVFKTPSEEDPSTVNAFLNTDDFFFEVLVNISGEITEVKFSIFSEPAKSSPLLKEIFCSWDWDSLSKHIDGIKQNYILTHTDHLIRAKGFKVIESLEKDLNVLYQIQLNYLDKFLKNSSALVSKANGNIRGQVNQSKYLEKLVNQTPIGVFKKSELGEPMRLYYYLSPMDLIQHHQNNKLDKGKIDGYDVTYKMLSSLTTEQLIKNELGSYLTISLLSNDKSAPDLNYFLPDCSVLMLKETDDERILNEAFAPYFNNSFNFEKNALFNKLTTTISKHNYGNKINGNPIPGIEIPGTYVVRLNKPVVMCKSTLEHLQSQIGIENFQLTNSDLIKNKPTPFFELLSKNTFSNNVLNDAYSVQLPDENQVYYITELHQSDCLGVLVDKILFTHPQDLLMILEILRKQLFFNELLLSCMKTLCTSAFSFNNNYNTTNLNYVSGQDILSSKQKNVRILEIGLSAPYVVSVIMQHPRLLCYTTIEIDVSSGNVETRFRDHNDLHNPNIISEIIRKCHSIPVTIRALLMKYKQSHNSNFKRRINMNNNSDNSDNNGNYSNQNNPGNNNYNSDQQFDNGNSNRNNMNNGNYHCSDGKENYKSNKLSHSDLSSDESDDDLFEAQEHVTPLSLMGQDTMNIYSTVPNRFAPSRRDSYRTNSSSSNSSGCENSRTPQSMFKISSSINKQKQIDHIENEQIRNKEKTNDIKKHKTESSDKKAEPLPESLYDQEIIDTFKKGTESKEVSKVSKSDEKNKSGFQTPTVPVKKPSSKGLKSNGENSQSPSPSPVLNNNPNTSLQPSNKKRKAPSNCESATSTPSSSSSLSQTLNQSVNSTPTNTIHPPSAKRKMTQSSTPGDFKRHTSLIENDGSTKTTSLSSGGKKVKLKSSSSSVELTSTVKSSSENAKKADIKSNSQTLQKKDSMLSAVISNNPSPSNKSSSKSSSSSKSANQNKKSSSTPSPLLSKDSNSKNQSPGIKLKTMTDDGLKVRISKGNEANKNRSSSSLSNKTNNLSATEMPLKQPSSSSPLLTANSINSNNTSTPGILSNEISKNVSNTRTPSPLLVSALSNLATPSPILSDDQSEQSEGSNSNSTIPKIKSKHRSESSTSSISSSNLSSSKSSSSSKPNTPPLTSSNSPSLASFALGLGSSFKTTSFKIPHKTKKDSNDDDIPLKTPLSTSSPVVNNNTSKTLGSPSKQTSQQTDTKPSKSTSNRNIMPPPLPLGGNKNSSNSSPKWQANYSGNMSPRYINNYDNSSNTSSSSSSHSPSSSSKSANSKFDNNTKQPLKGSHPHRITTSSTNSRPITPIPAQFSSQSQNISNNRQNYTKNQPVPSSSSTSSSSSSSSQAQAKSQIMPLMSFNPSQSINSSTKNNTLNSNKNINDDLSQETPSSPPMYPNDSIECNATPKLIPIIPETKPISVSLSIPIVPITAQVNDNKANHSVSPTPQPPDSPTSESLPVFVPKVIPLERNISNNEFQSSKDVVKNNSIKKPAAKSSKLKSVDIASPDAIVEEDEDSLMIDFQNQNPSNITTTSIPTTQSTTHLFSTRQLISTNEVLSNTNSQIKSPSSTMKENSPSYQNQISSKSGSSTKSPTILEEDLLNEALTG